MKREDRRVSGPILERKISGAIKSNRGTTAPNAKVLTKEKLKENLQVKSIVSARPLHDDICITIESKIVDQSCC
jgi:hypothetical protein